MADLNNFRIRLATCISEANRLAAENDRSGYNGKKHDAQEWAAIGEALEDISTELHRFGTEPEAFKVALKAQEFSKYCANEIAFCLGWKRVPGIDGFSGDTRPFV